MERHPDSDRLLSAVFPFAQQMLAKRGTFLPFGATVLADGNVALAAGMADALQGAPQQIIDLLLAGFKKQAAAGEIRAAVVCYDGRAFSPQTGEKQDAICAEIGHPTEGCASVFLSYRKRWFGKVTYGQVFGAHRQPRVFGS